MRFYNKNNWLFGISLAGLSCLSGTLPTKADESPFSHVYTAEVLPQGELTVKVLVVMPGLK